MTVVDRPPHVLYLTSRTQESEVEKDFHTGPMPCGKAPLAARHTRATDVYYAWEEFAELAPQPIQYT